MGFNERAECKFGDCHIKVSRYFIIVEFLEKLLVGAVPGAAPAFS
jgi:hypothetical protein